MATFEEFYNSLPEDSNKRGELFEKDIQYQVLVAAALWSNEDGFVHCEDFSAMTSKNNHK